MIITQQQIKKAFGKFAKANLTLGTVTKITTANAGIIVKCVSLNKLTPTGQNKKALRILEAWRVGK